MSDWQRAAWDESIRRQTISLNPQAALQRSILRAGFVPVESEFELSGRTFQAAEHPATGERRLYLTAPPDWAVSWFGEPAGYALAPDISSNQGEIDWPKLGAQLRANGATDLQVAMRGPMGEKGVDMRLDEYHREARLNGFKRRMYGLWKPHLSAEKQAKNFVDVYRLYEWELSPAGDFEIAPADGRNVGNEIFAYLSEISNRLGALPMVYTGRFWWQRWVGNVGWAAAFPLWLAAHYNPPATIHPPERFYPGDLPYGWTGDFPSGGWQFSATMPGKAWGVQSAGLDLSWMTL